MLKNILFTVLSFYLTQNFLNEMGIYYTYTTGNISHFAVKKVGRKCKSKPLIGVLCKTCKDYCGMVDEKYVLCSNPCESDYEDNEDVRDIHSKVYNNLKDNALRALDY